MERHNLRNMLLTAALWLLCLSPLFAQEWYPDPGYPHPQMQVIMDSWEQAVRSSNPELLVRDYSPDAVRLIIEADGHQHYFKGTEAIIESQKIVEDGLDPQTRELQSGFILPDPVLIELPENPIPACMCEYPEHIGVFIFEERYGSLYISREIQLSLISEEFPADTFQVPLADCNGDGVMEGREQLLLAQWYRLVSSAPHRIETLLDEYFDWDGNGRLDEAEVRRAGAVVFRDQLRFGMDLLSEAIRELINLDNDPYISLFEAEIA